jgi:hypothetical protein
MSSDDPIVVQPHQLDRVADVRVVLDPPCRGPAAVREHRVRRDASFVFQHHPRLLREEVVRGVVAVQVPDLAMADLERELAAAARSR